MDDKVCDKDVELSCEEDDEVERHVYRVCLLLVIAGIWFVADSVSLDRKKVSRDVCYIFDVAFLFVTFG